MSASTFGVNLVRVAYLDESGRSRREPIIVVAGVIIHGDRSYRAIEDHLAAIVAAHIPEQDHDGFVFHASDLFHGSGYFNREKWPRNKRNEILAELARVPYNFSLPVVYGHMNKASYRLEIWDQVLDHSERNREKIIEVAEHMTAFARAEIAIERQMHKYPRDEICMLICEDTDLVKKAVKQSHAVLRARQKSSKEVVDFFFAESGLDDDVGVPLRKIVDTPHFAAKQDSSLLQVADVCAFLIMRRFNRREDSQPLFEIIAPQLYWRAVEIGDRMGAEQICGGRLY